MYRREDGIVHYHDLDREPLATEDEAFWYRLNSVYLDMVHRVDQELGDLLAAIDNNTNAPGLKDRTAFFVSSDHGDFSGNHHLVEKWPGAVDDLLTHVPFVARMPSPEYLPKGFVGAQNHVVEEQIQVFDIMPTALELAGIVPNRTHFATSLVPQLMGWFTSNLISVVCDRGPGQSSLSPSALADFKCMLQPQTGRFLTDRDGVLIGAKGDADRVVYSDGGFFYPTEIEPMAGNGLTSYP